MSRKTYFFMDEARLLPDLCGGAGELFRNVLEELRKPPRVIEVAGMKVILDSSMPKDQIEIRGRCGRAIIHNLKEPS